MMRKESTIEATAQISDGVDEETAERLWATLDTDRNGVLDRSEVHAIFAMQCTQLIERLESEAKQLTTAVQELSTSAKVMLAMDVDGDGKIQRHEFIQAATAGFLIQMGSP
jgi:Ca2+-binding EF-hand superfamily protein